MPIITISRGTLSGGKATAECLSDGLAYPCIGREILQQAASVAGASEEELSKKLEAPPSRWARVTKERKEYLLAVQTALAEKCVTGKLVYHGLAGQFLLRELPGVLAVRLIAPLEMRVRSLMGSQPAMTRKAAEEFIHHVDEDRRRWVRVMYGANVEDPTLYDLTVNLDPISLDTACQIIAEAAIQPQYEVTDEVLEKLEAFAKSSREQLQRLGEN